ncbi:hypothetical protein Bbelb_309570 [Branchiostoma belcheri]|nr:hypothetical protein Bbelb_309570 [Branchiostoma belcheri]
MTAPETREVKYGLTYHRPFPRQSGPPEFINGDPFTGTQGRVYMPDVQRDSRTNNRETKPPRRPQNGPTDAWCPPRPPYGVCLNTSTDVNRPQPTAKWVNMQYTWANNLFQRSGYIVYASMNEI